LKEPGNTSDERKGREEFYLEKRKNRLVKKERRRPPLVSFGSGKKRKTNGKKLGKREKSTEERETGEQKRIKEGP